MRSISRWVGIPVVAAALFLATGTVALSARPGGVQTYATVTGIDLSKVRYRDGVYTGTATGFRPNLTVRVTVGGGKVTKIEVVSHSEVESRFYAYPIRVIPPEIIKRQNTSVDVVSGATATSKGIMAAVEAALLGAAL